MNGQAPLPVFMQEADGRVASQQSRAQFFSSASDMTV